MPNKISFLINVKNEQPRIGYILGHARRWADEIVVIDKGSTDKTVAMCKTYPDVKVIIDDKHDRYGDEDRVSWVNIPENDWVFVGTPSEVPTVKLISECRKMVEGDYDLITVPRKMYMLGIHSDKSPWYIGNYKFLINRTRTNVSNRIHHNFSAKNGKEGHIQYADDCCVYHLTYTSALYWMRTMIDYWQMEAEGSTDPEMDIKRCFDAIRANEPKLKAGGKELFILYLAWNMYQMGTAFFLEEKRRGVDITGEYKKIYDRLMKEWENTP